MKNVIQEDVCQKTITSAKNDAVAQKQSFFLIIIIKKLELKNNIFIHRSFTSSFIDPFQLHKILVVDQGKTRYKFAYDNFNVNF